MSFLEEIKSFCKEKLKSVETLVRTPDGRELMESKDSSTGKVCVRLCCGKGLGFVGDVKPDLQVATIIPGLSLGSQDVAHEFAVLKKHSVTHILNLATGIPNSFEGSFQYKRINILDLPDVNIRAIFEECFHFINSALNEGGHVFVHCNAGISRSATVVIAYLMKHQRMTYVEALITVKQIRPSVRPNDGFTTQLAQYGQELFENEVEATGRPSQLKKFSRQDYF